MRHVAGAALAALAVAACTAGSAGVATRMGVPGAAAPAFATLVGKRGPYLDATVSYGGDETRFFFPDDDFCRALLDRGEGLEFSSEGSFGQLRHAEVVCEPIGLLSLEARRDERPRPRLSGPLPRGRADYRVFHVDEDLFLARGRFPLAGLIGLAGAFDIVAVVPNVPACEEIMTERAGTLEFHHSGEHAFVLLDDRLECPVLGFAQPVGEKGKR